MVNFINTAPLYEVWKETVNRPDWQVVEAAPSRLNKLLYDGTLDLGFVSSQEYAVHPDKYKILSGLSISATGAVGSVYLFSHKPLEQLDDELVQLSQQSQTSNSLIKIILEKFYNVQPLYCMEDDNELPEDIKTVLAIGDRALRLKKSGTYKYVMDLSQSWYEFTGLGFVFAVWAVRDEFYKHNFECVKEIHRELSRCVAEGTRNLTAISNKVAPRIPMAADLCKEYLQQIEYDLSDEKIKSLELFYQYLIERGEADSRALPLKIINK